MTRILQLLLGLVAAALPVAPSHAGDPDYPPDYVLVQKYEYSSEDLDGGGSGSGSGNTVLAERIIEQLSGAVEIEYSIPGDFSKVRGNAMWMFPARVMVASDGTKTLLNTAELEERVDSWLNEAKWPRELCGQWIFTWTAMQILCDPAAVIDQIEANDMRPGILAEGRVIKLNDNELEAVLSEIESDDLGRVFTATAQINSEFARRQAAQSKIIAAQVRGVEITMEQAREQVASMTAEGSVTVTFTVDEEGVVLKRAETYDITVRDDEDGGNRRIGTSTVFRVSYEDWLNG